MSQISLDDEIIVDLFAGGGGASTGIELATGRVVDIAINHDPAAILLHKTNHPFTEHFQESVWAVDPVKVCRGRPVGLLWASPDCKHFSRASGRALKNRKIRGLAWIVLRWAGTVRPRVILLENVSEFLDWCPVRRGKPIKSKKGETFRKWLGQLQALGYEVEWRKLTACDYGAPTSRERLVICARCDGKPIVFPTPTHGAPDSEGVKNGELKPWRTAAEIIDWSLPSYSIFASKTEIKEQYGMNAVRPLADNTMKRIARGLDKFVIKADKPFIVPRGYGERDGQAPRTHDIDAPLPTVVGSDKHYICQPELSPYIMCNNDVNVGRSVDDPVPTVTATLRNFLATAALVQYHDRDDAQYTLKRPLMTVDGSNRYGLVAAYLTQYFGGAEHGQRADAPMLTQTTKDREAVVAAYMTKYFTGVSGNSADEPLSTITSIDHNATVAAYLAYFKGQDRGQAADVPLRTVTAGDGQFGRVEAVLVPYDGRDLGYWPQVREMLNAYCGYDIKPNEVLLLWVEGAWRYISNIYLRMLAPKELYAAMGFPLDYRFEFDYLGNAYPRTQQVAKCGNAVCPPLATAMVRTNFPEWCVSIDISTMEQLFNRVAI